MVTAPDPTTGLCADGSQPQSQPSMLQLLPLLLLNSNLSVADGTAPDPTTGLCADGSQPQPFNATVAPTTAPVPEQQLVCS